MKVNNFNNFDFTEDPCLYFTWGKKKASTLSLTVLVVIEMLNALNALSDEGSLLSVGLFANPTLIMAITCSMTLHAIILYVPFFWNIFGTVPLTLNDWKLVMMFCIPVILIDEVLKFFARIRTRKALLERR